MGAFWISLYESSSDHCQGKSLVGPFQLRMFCNSLRLLINSLSFAETTHREIHSPGSSTARADSGQRTTERWWISHSYWEIWKIVFLMSIKIISSIQKKNHENDAFQADWAKLMTALKPMKSVVFCWLWNWIWQDLGTLHLLMKSGRKIIPVICHIRLSECHAVGIPHVKRNGIVSVIFRDDENGKWIPKHHISGQKSPLTEQ